MINTTQMQINRLYLAVIKQAAKDIVFSDNVEYIQTAKDFFTNAELWDLDNSVDKMILNFKDNNNYDKLVEYLEII